MSALCHASGRFAKMREVCSKPVAKSSFSEAQHVFEPEVLAGVLRQLACEAKGRAQFGDERVRRAIQALTLVDGTVLRSLNRMAWAPARMSHLSASETVPVATMSGWSGALSEIGPTKASARSPG